MKQGERNVYKFFTDLKIIWEELKSLSTLQTVFVK